MSEMNQRLDYLVGHMEREVARLKEMAADEGLSRIAQERCVLERVLAINNWLSDLIGWCLEEDE